MLGSATDSVLEFPLLMGTENIFSPHPGMGGGELWEPWGKWQ